MKFIEVDLCMVLENEKESVMKDRYRNKNKILLKLLYTLAFSVLVSLSVLSCFFFQSVQNNAVERYERETLSAMNVFSKNIDYYVSTFVDAGKSVYSNSVLTDMLSSRKKHILTSSERDLIFEYLRTVHYSCSTSMQVYLVCDRLGQSYLYYPSNMSMTYRPLDPDVEMPEFESYMDVQIQSTHTINNYSHLLKFTKTEEGTQVITIWIPIYDLPRNTTDRIGCLAIDIPVDFFLNNSQLTIAENETIYIVDEQDTIIVSSDRSMIGQKMSHISSNIQTADTWLERINGGDSMLLIDYDVEVEHCNWKMYKTIPFRNIYDTTWELMMGYLMTFASLLLLILLINAVQITHVVNPIKKMNDYMGQMMDVPELDNGETLKKRLAYHNQDEISELIETFDNMISALRNSRIERYEIELAYNRSIFRMLQSQINPHFIYNTLQCFATAALRHKDIEQYRLMTSFGQMMHYAMVINPSTVPLRQELDYVEKYVSLQKMRFKTDENVQYDIEEGAEHVLVPKMCLQPLVENSITHGRVFREPGKRLMIQAKFSQNKEHIILRIVDDGKAISPEKQKEMAERLEGIRRGTVIDGAETSRENLFLENVSGNGKEGEHPSIGIANIYWRLLLMFSDVQMTVEPNDLGGTTVEIAILRQERKKVITAS